MRGCHPGAPEVAFDIIRRLTVSPMRIGVHDPAPSRRPAGPWAGGREPRAVRTGAVRHAGRCHPAIRAGPAAGRPGRGRRRDRRRPAAQRLGGLSPVPLRQLLGQHVLLRGALPGRSSHRPAGEREHLEPEPEHVALRQRGSVHRLPARCGDGRRPRQPERRRGLVSWTRAFSRRSRRPTSFSTRSPPRQLVARARDQRSPGRGAAQDLGRQAPRRAPPRDPTPFARWLRWAARSST